MSTLHETASIGIVTEFYLGIATFEAAIFGIFLAALFVLVQISITEFSALVPRIIWSGRPFRVLAALVIFTVSFALAGSLRAAFPTSDFVGFVNLQTDHVFLGGPWAGVGLISAALSTSILCVILLLYLFGRLDRPALVQMVLSQAPLDSWSRPTLDKKGTVKYPAEYRDPLGPTTELLVNGIKRYEYDNVKLGLQALTTRVSQLIMEDSQRAPGVARNDMAAVAALLTGHLRVLPETASAVNYRAVNPLVVEAAAQLSFALLSADQQQAAGGFLEFLLETGERFDLERDDAALGAVIESLGRIGAKSIEKSQDPVFDDVARHLGGLGERVARRSPPKPRILGWIDSQASLLEHLENAFNEVQQALCPNRNTVLLEPKIYHDAVFAVVRALIEQCPPVEDHAVTFIENTAKIGEASARQPNDRALWLACLSLGEMLEDSSRVNAKQVRTHIVDALFLIGLLAQDNNGAVSSDDCPYLKGAGNDRVQVVLDNLKDADVSDLLAAKRLHYLAGQTAHLKGQKDFVVRLGQENGIANFEHLR